jgi:hypothetical protein
MCLPDLSLSSIPTNCKRELVSAHCFHFGTITEKIVCYDSGSLNITPKGDVFQSSTWVSRLIESSRTLTAVKTETMQQQESQTPFHNPHGTLSLSANVSSSHIPSPPQTRTSLRSPNPPTPTVSTPYSHSPQPTSQPSPLLRRHPSAKSAPVIHIISQHRAHLH